MRSIVNRLGQGWTGVLFLALALSFSSGCEEAPDVAPAANATPRQLRLVKNGTQMVSPISGKTITKTSTTPAAVWDGKLYMFCCAVDRDKFKEDPREHSKGVLPPNAAIIEAKEQ